jgi:hypothetical protein
MDGEGDLAVLPAAAPDDEFAQADTAADSSATQT